jgi:hypothetical protein
MFNVHLLNVAPLSDNHLNFALPNFVVLVIILVNVVLLSAILMNVIHLNVALVIVFF